MRKDVRHLAGRLMGKDLDDTTHDELAAVVADSTGDEETPGPLQRPPSDTGSASSNPWREAAGAGPSQPARSTSYTRARRLSYDAATGVMNLPDDDGWMSPPGDDDSDEDVTGTSGEATPGEESEEHRPALNGEGSAGQRVGRRASTYWHHPERKRAVSGSFA